MVRIRAESFCPGEVEVDETYVGGREVGRYVWRKTNKKSIVAIAAEIRGRGTGRIRMARVEDASRREPHSISRRNGCVQPGATIRTDGWRGLQCVCTAESASEHRASEKYGHVPQRLEPKAHMAVECPRSSSGSRPSLDRW